MCIEKATSHAAATEERNERDGDGEGRKSPRWDDWRGPTACCPLLLLLLFLHHWPSTLSDKAVVAGKKDETNRVSTVQ
ncbi:hypothetical protein CDD83_5202 [Cordyceps sp. RAO-2017]|nr:hypothetical protein CDD83_5202 [Cordyceps sp. RAO-2017]